MATITVYLDDSAEERRRRRRRVIEIVIILLLLGGVAVGRRTQLASASTPRTIVVTKTVEVPVPQYWSFEEQGPHRPPPPVPTVPAQSGNGSGSGSRVIVKAPLSVVADPVFVFGTFPVSTGWNDVGVPIERQRVLTAHVAPRQIHFIRPGSKRVIISNPHDQPIRIRRIVLEGAGYSLKGDEECRTLLNPGTDCTFSVVAKVVSGYTPPARLTIE